MIISFTIAFREALEACLVIGIILAYLIKTKRESYSRSLYLGAAAAIAASFLIAGILYYFFSAFSGQLELILNGFMLLIASVLITSLVIWTFKHETPEKEVQRKVEEGIRKRKQTGLFFIVFTTVLREGVETIILLEAVSFVSPQNNLIGALAGVAAATLLGYAIYRFGKRLKPKLFINITSVLLIIFAAFILVESIGEFQKSGILQGAGYSPYLEIAVLVAYALILLFFYSRNGHLSYREKR